MNDAPLAGFMAINDTHGYATADQLLRAVADRLSALARPDELVARLGGEKFVVVQTHVADGLDAEHLAAVIVEALGRPSRPDGVELTASASVGVAVAAREPVDPGTLLAEADAALSASKAQGRRRFTLRRSALPAS